MFTVNEQLKNLCILNTILTISPLSQIPVDLQKQKNYLEVSRCVGKHPLVDSQEECN